jgi:glutamyl-tRNA reductase
MLVSPTIQKLKQSLEQIRLEELSRHVKQVDQKQLELIEKITKNMMQKILKIPVVQLKAACQRNEASQMIALLHDLFDLENQNKEK